MARRVGRRRGRREGVVLGCERGFGGAQSSGMVGGVGSVMQGSRSSARGEGPFVSPSQWKSSAERAGKD